MLTFLRIKNFITIDQLELNFHSGLTVFTGESGVGKSVLFSALYTLLGQAFSLNMIKASKDFAECEALFDISSLKNSFLSDLAQDDQELLIYRKLTRSKQQIIKINGRTVTQKLLKEVSQHIAIVVSQHDQLGLFKSDQQLFMIDQLTPGISTLKSDYFTLYQDYSQLKKKWNDLQSIKDDMAQQAFFQFQYDDIHQHQFNPTEETDLQDSKKKIQQQSALSDSSRSLVRQFKDSLNALHEAQRIIQSDIFQDSEGSFKHIDNLVAEIEEFAFQSERLSDSLQVNPGMSVSSIEERIDLIFRYCSKYNVLNVRELCKLESTLAQKIELLSSHKTHLQNLQEQLSKSKDTLLNKANELTALRQKTAGLIKHSIESSLAELGLVSPVFEVNFYQSSEFNAAGQDQIQFCLATLKGHEPKPLANVVSGGELSRLLLAFYSLFSEQSFSKLFLFDEIDTGVGGLIANSIGEKLAIIAQTHQVFCITHLAQIASKAQQHLVFKKPLADSQTEVTYVDTHHDSIEIKRMLGGEELLNTLIS